MHRQLKYPFRYDWHHDDGVAVIGWCYSGEVIAEGKDLADRFRDISGPDDLKQRLSGLNGHFAVVLQGSGWTAAAVDITRSFPVLYTFAEGGIRFYCDISDLDLSRNEKAETAFRECWCVPGNATLLQGLHQLMAGQFIWQEGNEAAAPDYYYRHSVPAKAREERADLLAMGEQLLDRVFDRVVTGLKARGPGRVVVPLSGGYDSRLILAMLKKREMPDLLAYTYGRPGSHEARIAEQVASRLGIQWEFVAYDRELFGSFFSGQWARYSSANHFYTSLPHEQDFFALLRLRSLGVIKDGFTALPGYCGDLLGGSHTAYSPGRFGPEGLTEFIRERHFHGRPVDIGAPAWSFRPGKTAFFDAYQQYFAENKVTKFIVNSVRVYEHFGGDWRMPLWDRELADFFYALPYELRYRQNLYNELLFDRIFKPMGIDIRKPGFDDNYPSRLKTALRRKVPDLYGAVKKRMRKEQDGDPVNLSVLNEMVIEGTEGEPAAASAEFNDSHSKYFLQNLNK